MWGGCQGGAKPKPDPSWCRPVTGQEEMGTKLNTGNCI